MWLEKDISARPLQNKFIVRSHECMTTMETSSYGSFYLFITSDTHSSDMLVYGFISPFVEGIIKAAQVNIFISTVLVETNSLNRQRTLLLLSGVFVKKAKKDQEGNCGIRI